MTEAEYIAATNLARYRAAAAVLDDCVSVSRGSDADDLTRATKALSRLISRGYKTVKIEDHP
jgi:hypothetical protein